MAYWLQSSAAAGISREVAKTQLQSIVKQTLIMYQKNWRRFSSWCCEKQTHYGEITVNVICEYLLFLFNSKTPSGKDFSSGELNKVRSSLAFFLQYDIPKLGNEMPVVRLFNYFYKTRPNFPRYLVTWDVGLVLKFLAKWHPIENLSLKQLTLKTVTLVALTSSDRAQTIHALRADNVHVSSEGLVFVVPSILKHSRRGDPASKVVCVSWDAPELNVADYVLAYMNKMLKFRRKSWEKDKKDIKQLFLSHRTGKPVKKQTISRWIREVMEMSGIDISVYGPHSTRGASISEATRRGASVDNLMKHGHWKNLGTYSRFYNRELCETPVGRLILQASRCKFPLLSFFILTIPKNSFFGSLLKLI